MAPPAVSVIVFGDPLNAWEQSVALLSCALREGGGTTFTVLWAELVQPFKLPITVYTVVEVGYAFVKVPLFVLMLVLGNHV